MRGKARLLLHARISLFVALLRVDKVLRLFPCARSVSLASSCEDKPFHGSSPCGRSPACLFPRARLGPLVPHGRTSPFVALLHADAVQCLFPSAKSSPLASMCEDKPFRDSAPCRRSPAPVSSCEVRPDCFHEQGHAFSRLRSMRT